MTPRSGKIGLNSGKSEGVRKWIVQPGFYLLICMLTKRITQRNQHTHDLGYVTDPASQVPSQTHPQNDRSVRM